VIMVQNQESKLKIKTVKLIG